MVIAASCARSATSRATCCTSWRAAASTPTSCARARTLARRSPRSRISATPTSVATVLPSAPKVGTVHLVGAGPGAVDLLTLRAIRILGQADVVFHDALVSREILDLAPQAEKIAVGKRSGRFSTAQRFINKQLADAARKHRVVVRLKGGDPMLFGRAHEEIDFLRKSSIQVEVVPGITAA